MSDADTLSGALGDYIKAQIAAALPTAQPSDTVLLEIKDVCGRTKMARSTIYELIKSGELSSVRIGHRVFIRETALAGFIAAHASDGTA